MRIVADASATQSEGRLAQLERVDSRHAQVDRFRLNVQAVLGDSGGVRAERLVRRGRAVAAHDVDLSAGMPDRRREIVENIVEPRIKVANIAGPMIAQEIIELGERARNVLVSAPVSNFHPLTGVRVIKPQDMILPDPDCVTPQAPQVLLRAIGPVRHPAHSPAALQLESPDTQKFFQTRAFISFQENFNISNRLARFVRILQAPFFCFWHGEAARIQKSATSSEIGDRD